jgi:hypothetical protein
VSQRHPRPGDVLRLTPEDARYLDEPVLFRVIATRPDVSRYYEGAWIWVDGEVLGEDGSVRRLPLLIRVED